MAVIKPFLMADIGEGITECEIIQWFVKPEARVEEWDKLCEVTSDKASVEITSRFSGVIKKLYYEPGEMVKVGKPLVDIDIPSDNKEEEAKGLKENLTSKSGVSNLVKCVDGTAQQTSSKGITGTPTPDLKTLSKGNLANLATPAVRHLIRELNLKIEDIPGTGKDNRVLKQDVYQYAKQQNAILADSSKSDETPCPTNEKSSPSPKEAILQLSPSQYSMFKKMTKSLSIPHFLYADEIDFSALSELRGRLNKGLAENPIEDVKKLTFLPFIIKAMSLSLLRYPILNAKLDYNSSSNKPFLILRSQHNIGIAMDTPSGLLVPVVKNVSSLSLLTIASKLARLQRLAISGNLTSQDLSGGTITVSNIGSIGGTYVSPVIVENESAILGVGKIRTVPAFSDSCDLVRKQTCNFSWSADHRIIDGATMARAAEAIRVLLENPESMLLHLR